MRWLVETSNECEETEGRLPPRRPRPIPNDGEPQEIPVEESFWWSYRSHLCCAGAGVLASTLLAALVSADVGGYGWEPFRTICACIALIVLPLSLLLPIHWYRRFRRMRESLAARLDEPRDGGGERVLSLDRDQPDSSTLGRDGVATESEAAVESRASSGRRSDSRKEAS